jgi:hypothetical protein
VLLSLPRTGGGASAWEARPDRASNVTYVKDVRPLIEYNPYSEREPGSIVAKATKKQPDSQTLLFANGRVLTVRLPHNCSHSGTASEAKWRH